MTVSESGGTNVTTAGSGTLSVAIIEPAGVKAITGIDVTEGDIARASALVGLVINRDLSDTVWMSKRYQQDYNLLRQAVAWEASEDTTVVQTSTTTTTEGGTSAADSGIAIPDSVKSVSLGDISLTMRDPITTTASATVIANPLCNLATLAIARLSWRRRNTLRASPMVVDDWLQPDRALLQSMTDDGEDKDWTPL